MESREQEEERGAGGRRARCHIYPTQPAYAASQATDIRIYRLASGLEDQLTKLSGIKGEGFHGHGRFPWQQTSDPIMIHSIGEQCVVWMPIQVDVRYSIGILLLTIHSESRVSCLTTFIEPCGDSAWQTFLPSEDDLPNLVPASFQYTVILWCLAVSIA